MVLEIIVDYCIYPIIFSSIAFREYSLKYNGHCIFMEGIVLWDNEIWSRISRIHLKI